MSTSQTTAAPAFKSAMFTTLETLFADTDVLVCYGTPGTLAPDDIIAVRGVRAEQVAATLGTQRSREETLKLQVRFSCFRGGGPEAEQIASDRAYELLSIIERYVRVTDTTLGGVVRYAFLSESESEGETDPEWIAQGRVIEIEATFTAQARITGR